MKAKWTMMVAMAAACAAIQLTAMPTEEEARKAEPVVKKMLAQERAALESGRKTRSEVAAAAMKLAGEADSDAAKLLLMKGAFALYVKDGNLAKAVETMRALEVAIADMPPQSVTNMIEAALLGVSKKEDHTRLYKLLDDNKADLSSHVESKLVSSSVEERSSIASILKGMIKVPGRDYWLSTTELTQGQWESVMGYNLSSHKGKNLPVENVSRDDCDVFLEKLNQTKEVKASQFEFRLPELEEWKYAAWAGSAGNGSWIKPGVVGDVLDMAWVEANSSNQTHAVATKAPNAFGFYDMLGNVWEWLSGDAPGGGKGALKGCAFNQAADKCTWNANCYIRKTELNCSCGLRLAAHLRSTMRERQREELLQIQEELRRQREARQATNAAAQQQQATVDGYTWSYRENNGEATIVAVAGVIFSCAVSPMPTGDVKIPATLNGVRVTRIGRDAFRNCKGLTSMTIPDGVTHIEGRAFELCDGLKAVTLPSSLKVVGFAAFGNCAGLTSVVIPEGVTSIDKDAFNGCSGLKRVVIPNSVTKIGDRAFALCQGLTSLTMRGERPDATNNIFQGCGNLKAIHVPANAKSWAGMKDWLGIPLMFDGEAVKEHVDAQTQEMSVVANKLQSCDFLLNKDFKKNAKYYLCLFSASWCGPCRREMPRIAKTYVEKLKDDPDIEFIHFSRDQNDEKALAWANEHDVKFPVVKPNGGNPLDLRARGIPHLFIVKADGTLIEEGHPMKLFTDEKLRELKTANGGGEAKNMAKMTSSGKETIDGVEWAYSIVDGKAQLDRVVSSNVTGSITIPSALGGCPVTSIGRNELRSGFGWRVFEKCCNMSSVAIPSGVMNIGDSAFFGCSNMVSVTIPSSVTNIARCAFSNCGRLTSFAVDEENTKYSSRNELLCSNDGTTLVEGVNGDVSIPTCVKNIKDDAFKGRTGLKSVMVPSSVTSIGSSAFSDCRGLSSVAIPASVKKIGRYAFWNCSGLKSFSVDSDNPSYSARDGMLCSKDGSTLFCGVNGDVTIPSCVQNIADGAFSDCTGLTSVTIPDSVTCIAHNAFRGCDSLTSVMISPRVTSIGTYAFLGCKKLVSVTIPSSVAKIGGSAFSGCDKLMSFTVDPDNPSYSSHNGMLCSKDGLTLVAGVNGDVTIPSCVQNIADDAFSGCTGLTSVTISNSVKSIGTYAFSRCESLKSVTIPNSVTNIGERAFEGCSGLMGVTIPNSVKSIGTYAFSGCKSLKSVTIPDGVTSIVNAAFSGCESLTSVTIPSSVTSIGDYAFYYCSGLTNVVIGSGVTSIGIGAFYECSALKTVTVPSRVTSIGRLAFGKTEFYDDMSDGMVILGDGVLYQYKGECPSAVTIPSNVTRIGERAFRGCSGLETMTIPSAVTDIDGRAFVDCPNLKSVHVVRDGKIEAMSFEDFFKRWKNVVAQRLNKCDFLLNGQFKKDAKVYLCLFSASWCPPCRREMPRIAKTYAETLKDDPDIELIHFSRDQNDEKALAWAKEHDVKFPVVKPNGGNPLDLRTRGIPHLFIVNADGTLVEEGHPMKLFTDEKLRELKSEQVVSGMTYTDNGGLTWSYAENDDGRIKITGVKMRSSSPITIPTLLNGRHVTRIGKDAFRGNAMITGVTIPGSIVGIEDFAFYGCPNLADLTILDGVTRIDGLDAFRYCKALRTITFPKSLKYIRNRALRDCPNVVRLNVASIEDWLSIRFVTPTSNPMCMSGASLYVNGKKITGEVVIPNGVRQINNYAFMGCNGMLSVIIPSSVESIGQSAFMYNERAKGDGGVRQVIRISSDIGTIRVGPLICDKDTSVEIMTRSECSFVGWEDDKGNLVEDPFHSNQWNTVKPRWKTKEAFPLNAAPGDITEIDLGNVPPLQFVYCPAGKFSMGYKEQPALSKVKEIEITSPFWVSKTPLRVDQLASLGLNSITDTRIGAAGIDDVSIVIQKLPSVLKERFGKMLPPGYVFRLPTEAEFEYLQKAETKDKNAQTNIWGVERLYSGGIIALLDRAPAYGRGVDVVNDVSNGTVWTVLAKVNYENQPDKDPVGWSDDPNWSVFRRRLTRDCKEGKLITNQRTNKLYGFYFVVAPDVDKLNKFYWK